MKGTLRLATRESSLAMTQARMVAAALRTRHPGLEVEIVGMTTRGDRVLDRPLAQVGGKGLFVKELEVALDAGRADIAVHSMKDVPMVVPAHFAIATFGTRENPLDAFVSNRHESLAALPAGAVVGTSSLRRECQLRRAHARLEVMPLRGNVNSRLAKLDADRYDAIILAAAGLTRLGMTSRIRALLPATESTPAIAQGILAIEYHGERTDLAALLEPFSDGPTAAMARAERALGLIVEGSCEVPVGAFAHVSGNRLAIEGFIGAPDGSRLVRDRMAGDMLEAESLGRALGHKLLSDGGRDLLRPLPRPPFARAPAAR